MDDPHFKKKFQDTNEVSSSCARRILNREEKLARQLRTNLAQRKSQARARKNDKGESGKNNAGDSESNTK